MNNTQIVLRHELSITFSRKSFLFVTFGLPLIGFIIFQGLGMLNRSNPNALDNLVGNSSQTEKNGFVDPGGIIDAQSAYYNENSYLIAYADETSASHALEAGDIEGYFIIPADVEESNQLIYIRPEFNPLAMADKSSSIEFAVLTGLLGGDEEMALRVLRPMDLEVIELAPPEYQRDKENMLTYFIPYATTMIFYIVIMGSASLLLNSISKEKENHVMEVLMTSVSPRELLTGKIIGLGLAGLGQAVIWVGTSYTLLRLSGKNFSLPESLQLPPSIMVWGIMFFLLGYAIYGSLMAGLGALVPNLKEATQATIVVIFPLLIPMFLMRVLIEDPYGTLSTVIGIFPLTAPVAMMTRLASGGIPFWQPLLAAALMLGTAYLIIRSVTRLFHAQILLSGQPFGVKRFVRVLFSGV